MFLRSAPPTHDSLRTRFGERYRGLILLVVGLGTIAGVLSTSSFNVAVPALTRHFGLGQERVQWAMTGFMAAMTLAMLPTPWLLERFGFRRLFLTAVSVLAAACVAGSQMESFTGVVLARLVQGAATGCLQPLGTLAVMRLFPAGRQGQATGMLSFGIVLAPAIAPALAGGLLDRFGWPSIFMLSLPFCLIAGGLGFFLLPAPQVRAERRFDWGGLVLLGVATLALIEWAASLRQGGGLLGANSLYGALAVITLVGAIRHVRRVEHPIITLDLFAHRNFAMGAIVSFAYGFGLFASTYLIPVFLQNALGYTASHAGATLIPSGIALALVIPVAGRLADRYPAKWVTVGGLALFGLSFALFAGLGGTITYAEIIAATIIGRIGLGLILPALSLATMRHLEPQQLGQSATLVSYARQVGGVLGVAGAAVFVDWREAIHGAAGPGVFTAYAESFAMLAVVFVLALIAALRIRPQAH